MIVTFRASRPTTQGLKSDWMKIALYDLNQVELEEWLASLGQPRYRARQIWRWLYKGLATDFVQMSDLPAPLRAELGHLALTGTLQPSGDVYSPDRLTHKVLFNLTDGETVETVLMRYRQRNTVCISTQVGCAMGCVFCATGQMGFVRNLTAGEIVEQVLHFARVLRSPGARVTHVVFMGMGEPLANYRAVWQAVETLNNADGFGLGARRMTLSTVGLVPGIRKLAQEQLQVNLAVSLHAPDDDLRQRLLPINQRYSLNDIVTVCRDYVKATGRRVSIEYALIAGVNDSVEQAERLAGLLRDLLCHVNLIPLNPTDGSPLRPPSRERVNLFRAELEKHHLSTTVRVRRGIDIQAGCGQLRSRLKQGAALAMSG